MPPEFPILIKEMPEVQIEKKRFNNILSSCRVAYRRGGCITEHCQYGRE